MTNNKGFSLLGTLIVAIIIVIATTAMMVNLTGGRRRVRMSRHRLESALLFKEIMQNLRCTPYGSFSGTTVNLSGIVSTLPDAFDEPEVTVTDITIPQVPAMQMKNVTITLSYKDPGGVARTDTRSFLLRGPANRGIY